MSKLIACHFLHHFCLRWSGIRSRGRGLEKSFRCKAECFAISIGTDYAYCEPPPWGSIRAALPGGPAGGVLRGLRSGHRSPLPQHPLASPTGLFGEVVPHSSPAGGHPYCSRPARRREAASLRSLPVSQRNVINRLDGSTTPHSSEVKSRLPEKKNASRSFWSRSSLRDRDQNDRDASWVNT